MTSTTGIAIPGTGIIITAHLSIVGPARTTDTAAGTAPGMTLTGLTTAGLVHSASFTAPVITTDGAAITTTGIAPTMDGIRITAAWVITEEVTGTTGCIPGPSS